jgi:hypothetical protein
VEHDRQPGQRAIWPGSRRSPEWKRTGGRWLLRLWSSGNGRNLQRRVRHLVGDRQRQRSPLRSAGRQLGKWKGAICGRMHEQLHRHDDQCGPYNPSTGTWSFTGSLHVPCYFYTATLLNSGKVLVVGGCNASSGNTVTATAELYDPNAGTWATAGSLSIAPDFQTATLLSDGRVLVAGGYGTSGTIAQAELYNPATGKWSSAGNLNNARAQSTATLLPSGKVLVAGGLDPNGARLSSAELYNPVTNSWALTGSLIDKRYNATATLLSGAKVLLAGGSGRPKRAASRLQNGKIPAVGGIGSTYLASAELYTP